MLKFGCAALGVTPEVVGELEALGYDSLWVGGHISTPNPTVEAMVCLSRLAALSKRATIGTSILLLPLYQPAIVAKQIADIDVYSGGRVVLGIGVGGEFEKEFRACGVPVKERGRRTDEAIPLIRRLWSGEVISHPGPYYPMSEVDLRPPPAQAGGPPIVVAGRQDAAMRRAATLGNGWMPYLYSPRRYGESVSKVRDFAEAAGKDLTNFEWMEYLFINVQDDAEAARNGAVEFLGGTYHQDFGPLIDRVAAAGTPESVAARVQEFVDAGARHFIFMPATKTDALGMAQRIMREVVPKIVAPGAAC